jgi:UDP-N-acetylmuramate dehydrogenase
MVRRSGVPSLVIGGGTNLIVSDAGFDGAVLRFRGARAERDGEVLKVESGAMLQEVVDKSIACGLRGMHTMTGIPGYLGGAVYGNAGAYGNSIHEVVERVIFTDGEGVHTFSNEACEFGYRESVFKRRKEWIILSACLRFRPGDPEVMRREADEIRAIRDAKYPPSMKCAGSIFKNVFYANLPEHVQVQVPATLIRDGKIPSAWFLEQAGVKGMRRGDIQIAEYHANLIYNDGHGRASDLVAVIEDCKARVRQHFGFDLEEEVQYVGFAPVTV